MGLARYKDIRASIVAAGFAEEIRWAETVMPPGNAEEFAREAIYIICNSGMRWTVARKIFDAVMPLVASGQSASGAFGHKGKVAAIDRIWADRDRFFGACRVLSHPMPISKTRRSGRPVSASAPIWLN